MRLILLCILALGTVGCGPTIGDACASNSDCAPGICLQRDFTPQGYCSMGCGNCPTGSVCVADAFGPQTPGCMRSCTQGSDCREGYVCQKQRDSPTPVCAGPQGI